FNNQNGTLESANTDLVLATGNLLNANGTLLHVGTGTLSIDSRQAMAAGGSLVTRGALSLSGNGLTNSSVIQAGRLSLNLTNFSQTADGQLLASDSLVGTGSNWNNDGLIASDGSIHLALGGAYAGNGRLSAAGDLTLSSDQVSLSSGASIVGGGTTRLNVGGALTNYGRLTSSGDLIVNAGSISNYGTLGSTQNLSLNTPTLLNEHGLIFAGGDLVLGVNTFTNHLADVYGLGNVRIGGYGGTARATSVYNIAGSLESVGDFSLKAAVFENRTDGATNSAGRKLTSGFIANICNDCQGDDWIVTLAAHEQFESDDSDASAAARLAAGRNFDFEGGTFLNSKSTVSAGGDITIVADSLQNIGSVAGTIERVRTYEISLKDNAMNDFLANVMTPYNQRNNPDFPLVYYIDGTGAIRKAIASSYLGREPGHDGGSYEFVKLTDTETGLVINDRYGWGFPLPGLSYGFEGNITSKYDPNNLVALPSQLAGLAPITDIEIAKDSTGGASTGTVRNAVIQAGGKVNITATQDLINSVIHEDYALSGSASKVEDTQIGAGPRVQVRINAQLPPDLAQQQVNPTTLPGFSLPTGQNGLFRLSGQDSSTGSTAPLSWTLGGASLLTGQHQNAGASVARVQGVPITSGGSHPQKYLIETNPVLTDLKQFMSSDYLLGKLGYDPDDSARRLGDGLYEQRLIQQAIVARTGQRFMDGMTSDEAQFRYLMDNAIASKDALSLSVGISLTAEQVAALTHDIVWLESEVIDGQTVLVPVLYLANANNRLAPNGALIQGSDVTLIAGNDLNNSGTLKATGNLSAAAGNNLVNSGLVNAGGRLDLLAGNDLTNKAGGIIAGRDVSLGAIGGDIINERTVTSYQNSGNGFSLQRDFVDNAARIEAANDLTVSAGRDVNNVGGVLQSGRDLSIGAGRDVNITTAVQIASNDRGANLNESSIKHYGAEVTAGQDLSIQAGRDLTVIGSQLNAGGNAALDAGNDLTIASSADEEHSYSKTKSVTEQEDHVHQNGSGVKVGGNVTLNAGNDLTLISSDVEAGDEAYLSAGNELALLAAQDSDYTLYDMKKKGGFGSEKTQHDEVTDIKNIGSQIKAGGDLSLVSGGDQHYQNAHLESGKDITLDSGGSITFEAVKDVHQESHTKSDNDAFWVSSEGKGNTDETLRQTQMVAGGNIAIKAVEGLHVDLNQINQNTVSQSIDAMVRADPQLAWLKDAEARGDVDWQLVQEIHQSFKYENSGLGPASQLIIAIVMAAIVGPAALGALGTAGATAGWAAAGAAVATGAATNATVSFINNGGDLGAVFKDVTSRNALKGYVIAGVTAGLTAEYFNELTGTTTNPTTGKINVNLGSLKGIGQFAASQGLQNASATALSKILGQGGDLGDALRTTLLNTLAAASFNAVGDYTNGVFDDGSLGKIAIHAMVGGLLTQIAGGDFKDGALAAGANEALINQLAGLVNKNPDLLVMSSQIVGLLAVAAIGGDVQQGADVARNATEYNHDNNHNYTKEVNEDLVDTLGERESLQQRSEHGNESIPIDLLPPVLGPMLGGAKNNPTGGGRYSNLTDSPSVGTGKNFTQTQKAKIYQQNMDKNGGVLRSDLDGQELVLPKKSASGVTPPSNEAQIDHIVPRRPADLNAPAGTNSYSNSQILSREQNRQKSNK
ncbi:DUF637 domain-containing protein, partial [Pseudomonas sp. OV226]|uniref:DUF637 domain-containing protein n=1 Tax=Pseudomonas sp. OV226 TaxID=2135588 RepID=UPI000D7AACAB